LTFFEGNITLELDSAEVFRGIGIFCRFFELKDFLSYRPLKRVWADPPTAVRFRVKRPCHLLSTFSGMYVVDVDDVVEHTSRPRFS
jgi:hypothetical protein